MSCIGLAAARADSGDTTGAVTVLTAALTDAEQSMGSLDGLTIEIRAHLAHGHAAVGAPARALLELGRAAADCETALGVTHPDTVALQADLAQLGRDGPATSESAAVGGADAGHTR